MCKYMRNMTKIVMYFNHYRPIYRTITISVHLRDGSGRVYGYSSNFNNHGIDAKMSLEFIDSCQELAQTLVKG